MRKIIYSIFALTLCTLVYGQDVVVRGQLLDNGTNEPLIGASVIHKTTAEGTVTDINGNFELALSQNTGDLEVSYLGYASQLITLDGSSNDYDLGNINLKSQSIGIEEILIVSDVARDRKTPVAATTLKGADIEAIIGNQEFPEVLRKTPSVYVTKQGGGFGDARINVRGFSQENVAVLINGIPVNDMENGRVFWSNWAGLGDVISRMQVQRGVGATKLATPNVGGSINIITNAAELERGGTASVAYGNDNYVKTALSYSSGLGDKGWAYTLQATHTRGDGYADGTKFRAWSYFAAISKTFNDQHTLAFTGLGAPQWHHQRLGASRFDRLSLRNFYDPDNTGEAGTNMGIKWNHGWGLLNGEEFTFRRNFYHKPKYFLNHYWDISDKTSLKTSAYVSLGRGGGTGPRGRLRTPGSIFDSFSGLGRGIHDQNGQIRFDDIVRYNQGQTVDGWGDAKQQQNGQYLVTSDGRFYFPDGSRNNNGSGFIRRASMNSHNWYGILSTLTSQLSPNINLVTGLDYRYYKGIHYRRLENLLGADGYFSRSDTNNPANIITEESPATFGNFSDNSYIDGNNVLNYHNDGLVRWVGLFAQLEYSKDDLTIFTSFNGSNQGFKRVDFFNYQDGSAQQETDWENFWGGTIKAGLNYNVTAVSNFYLNGGYFSRQPIFDNVYINFLNEVNPDIENQKVYSFEAGYGYRGARFSADVNLYSTVWTNRQFDQGIALPNNESGLAIFRGVGQKHQGVELEFDWLPPVYGLKVYGMVSLGNWRYSSDFVANVQNLDTNTPAGTATIFADGLKIDDAAQTTFTLGANYEVAPGFKIFADITSFGNLYAQYDIQDDQFLSPGGQVAQLPNYALMDAGASYNFDIGDNRAVIRMNVYNLLNKKYISEAFTNIMDDPSTPINEIYDNRGYMGFGTTWSTQFKVWF